ncbi:hypothetical protein DFJ74DRAFT_134382 [Hyaloraphidium curvatum]|nr:hypothetical protein DFJ74DRAFT_134382 [Hyaloraphidium curvatum]
MPLTEQQATDAFRAWVSNCNAHLGTPGAMTDFDWAWKLNGDPKNFVYVHTLEIAVGRDESDKALGRIAEAGMGIDEPEGVTAYMNYGSGVHVVVGKVATHSVKEFLPGGPKTIKATARLHLDDGGKIIRIESIVDPETRPALFEAMLKTTGSPKGAAEAEHALRSLVDTFQTRNVDKILESCTEDLQWIAPTGLFRGKGEEMKKGLLSLWIDVVGMDGSEITGPIRTIPHHRAEAKVTFKFGKAPDSLEIKELSTTLSVQVNPEGKVTRVAPLQVEEKEFEDARKVLAWAMANAGKGKA